MTHNPLRTHGSEGLGGFSRVDFQSMADRLNESRMAKSEEVYWYVRRADNGQESLEKFDTGIGTKAWIRDNHDEAKRQVIKLSGVDGSAADRILERLSGIA